MILIILFVCIIVYAIVDRYLNHREEMARIATGKCNADEEEQP